MPRKKPEPAKTSERDIWEEDASKLSYEEALQALDVLLWQLQTIPFHLPIYKEIMLVPRFTSTAATYF